MINSFIKRIASILRIEYPNIHYVSKLATDTQLASADYHTMTITIKSSASGYDLLFSIAHEMRHLWQMRYRSDMFLDYSGANAKLSSDQYNQQEAEIDAHAFAAAIMRTGFGVTPLFNNMNEDTKKEIYRRADQIIEKFHLGDM